MRLNSVEINTKLWPVCDVLPLLLKDHATQKNIIFATDFYSEHGVGYGAKNQITENILNGGKRCIIQPRILKNNDEQQKRTREKAEVFTPAWVCCLMNNHIDEEWFGRPDVFGQLNGQEWIPTEDPIEMPKRKRWQTYVDSRRLEITCGEAPYLVSRYDMATGEIIPIKDRIGILDRKLRIVNENAATEEEWLKWTLRAFQAVYGYEYQGDNLLVARINLLLTYIDYMQERWDRKPTKKELEEVAKVISWNLWQMDGLKGSVPLGALYEQYQQLTIFGMDEGAGEDEPEEYIPCRVYDWRGQNKSIEFNAFRERRNGSMKFDFIIGNPPYQDETVGDQKQFAAPIYDKFMNEAYKVADVVELIHPARFLFNAGSTPKAWNKQMLSDPHFKVLFHEHDSSKVFANTDIKGGVVITYRNRTKEYGAIGTFTVFPELQHILSIVYHSPNFESFRTIVTTRTAYRFVDKMHEDYPEAAGQLSAGHRYDMSTNIFDLLPFIFYDNKPADDKDYIRVYGRSNNERTYKYVRRDYVNNVNNLDKWKVFVPKSNGSGALGEVITTPVIGQPVIGHTESFISIGAFDTEKEAKACYKYICTKFARCMLGILKVTQDNPPDKWEYVPLQDFTGASDIDWSQSVAGIDRQLYAKYGLSDEEITFIETHVKEME